VLTGPPEVSVWRRQPRRPDGGAGPAGGGWGHAELQQPTKPRPREDYRVGSAAPRRDLYTDIVHQGSRADSSTGPDW